MKIKVLLLILAVGASTCLLTAQDNNQPPDGQRPPRSEGGRGGPGGPGMFHLLPPRAKEQLNLTEDQQKQLASLEAEVKAKLEKILTADQIKQLKQMRPPQRQGGRAGGGPGGPGGDGGNGQGGPGGDGGQQHPPNQ